MCVSWASGDTEMAAGSGREHGGGAVEGLNKRSSLQVERAQHAAATSIENVRVNHGRRNIRMT